MVGVWPYQILTLGITETGPLIGHDEGLNHNTIVHQYREIKHDAIVLYQRTITFSCTASTNQSPRLRSPTLHMQTLSAR